MSSDPGPLDPRHSVELDGEISEFDQLRVILGPDLMEQISALLDNLIPQTQYHPRGSDEYLAALETGAHVSDINEIIHGLGVLWEGYGWRAVVDFQELIIHQIVRLSVPTVQDSYGRTRLNKLVAVDPDDVALMTTAVNIANAPDARPHERDFTWAYQMGKTMADNNREWFALFQKAVEACEQGRSDRVWPILAGLPGLKDNRDRMMQGTLSLALAAMCLRDPVGSAVNMLNAGVPRSEFEPALLRRAQARRGK
jgi:hypothetical protein